MAAGSRHFEQSGVWIRAFNQIRLPSRDAEFVSDRIHPKRIQSPEIGSRKWAEKKAQTFADEVTVHYNPADPGESFLVQTSKMMLYLVIGISIFVILFGLVFF